MSNTPEPVDYCNYYKRPCTVRGGLCSMCGERKTTEPVDKLRHLPAPIQNPEITEMTVDGDHVTYKKSELLAYINRLIIEKQRETQTNAVAWAVGIVDELHTDMVDSLEHPDRLYKGVKNTLRDRYKTETGVDPAPSYPIKAELNITEESGDE